MKKYILIVLIILIIITILSNNKEERNTTIDENRSIFISYIELNEYIDKNSVKNSKENIKTMIKNINNLGFNTVILQVRSFSDAIYKSNIFPWSSTVSDKEGINPRFDVLKYFLKETNKYNMSLYAWINPYRVRTTNDIKSISTKNPAYKYINTDTLYINNGIHYNPAKEEVINLITNGVEELVKNYKVDGVLFDDYFYPSNDIDIKDYNLYIKSNNYIDLKTYHLNNVNKMVKQVHTICKKYNVKFGISPDGNIDNNYNKNYADVKKWCSSKEYIDFIMPQIYYGFYNETKAFNNVIKEWESIITNDIDFQIVLAFYKIGQVDKYAKSGSNEWIDNHDIIMREIILSRNSKNYKGFSLFRYDYLFNDKYKSNSINEEINNMMKVLN